jgi:hypothetical protein
MYYLMNKDKVVAEFHKRKQEALDTSVYFKITNVPDRSKLPFGFDDNINTWLNGRKSSKHNKHLKTLMVSLNCDDNEGFIQVTHAASINDTFWIKSDTENTQWKDVSLYTNEFTEVISKLAFEGVGLYSEKFSTTSPELACEGSFPKCFRKEKQTGEYGSDIFIYKRGSLVKLTESLKVKGIEPYCEAMASEIAQIISPQNAVSYDMTLLHGTLASRCNVFTNEDRGYASFAKLHSVTDNLSEIMRYFEEYGSEEYFREMLVIDALCFNEDRHAGNYGFIFDNDTMEILGIAPVFDLNISLMCYLKDNDFEDVGDKLIGMSPKLGEDFTRLGQVAMNDVIRDRVKDVRDFSFSFRGNDEFSVERVKFIEQVVRRQAEAVLSKDKLYTKDVFFSPALAEQEQHHKEVAEAKQVMNGFFEDIEDKYGDRFLFSVSGDDPECARLFAEIESYEVDIDFVSGTFDIIHGMKRLTLSELDAIDPEAGKAIKALQNELKQYAKENHYEAFKQFSDSSELFIKD